MLDFSNNTGALFTALGKVGNLLKLSDAYQITLEDALTDPASGLNPQLEEWPAVQAILGSQYIQLSNSPGQSLLSFCQVLAANIINRIVFDDMPQYNQNLTQNNTLASIAYVLDQMAAQNQTIPLQVVTSTSTNFTGLGNAVVISSVYRPFDGKTLENMFAETLTLVATSSSYSSTAQANQESISILGQGNQQNIVAFDWPLGSNVNVTLTVINPSASASQGNLLTNSNFEDFTSNVPDNFELVVGTAGVNVFEESGIIYDPTDGGKALRILGDGSTLVQLRQAFNSEDGTSSTLAIQTQYSICLFARRDGIAPAAGVLQVDLMNGDTGLVLNDIANTPCSFTVNLTGLTTVYLPFTGCFRTPAIMPESVYFRFHLTTPLTTGRSIYLDTFSQAIMKQLYTWGPFVNVHAGSVPLQIGDTGTVVTTNARGGAGSLTSWQTLLFRLFSDVSGSEILFPSSASATISNTLIS